LCVLLVQVCRRIDLDRITDTLVYFPSDILVIIQYKSLVKENH